jgi:hypothetical protein
VNSTKWKVGERDISKSKSGNLELDLEIPMKFGSMGHLLLNPKIPETQE